MEGADEDQQGPPLFPYPSPLMVSQLGKLLVAELKDICSGLGLPVSGTKAVLVERVEAALTKL